MQGSANPFGPEETSLPKAIFDEAVAALPIRLLTSGLLDLQTTVAPLIGIEEIRTG
jgi:tRNA(Leu) C34 or U34 (ribose-2'-O)-methylase TrmL